MNWDEKFRDISQLGATTLLATVLTMVEGVVAAKILGPTVLGIWFTLQLALRYGGRLHLGVPNAFRRQLSVERGARNEADIEHISDTVATFLLITIFVQVSSLSAIHLWPNFSQELRFAALFGIFIIAFQTGRSFVHPYYNGVGDFRGASILRIVKSFTILLTIGLTIHYQFVGFLLGRTLREVVPFIVGFYRIGYWPSISLDIEVLQRLLQIGFLIMVVSFSAQLFKTVDRLMIIWFYPSESLGYYGTGDTFATLLMTVSSVVTNVLYTSFSEKYGSDVTTSQFKNEIRDTVKVFSYFFPIIFVFLYISVPVIIHVALPEYPASIPVARALAFGYVFFAGASVVGSVLHSFNEQRLYAIVVSVGIVMNAGLNYVIISLGGTLTGISIATAAAYLVYFTIAVSVVLLYFDASVQTVVSTILQMTVPSAVALLYVYFVSDMVTISQASLDVETFWTTLVLLSAVLPLIVIFGILTVRESEIDLSRFRLRRF